MIISASLLELFTDEHVTACCIPQETKFGCMNDTQLGRLPWGENYTTQLWGRRLSHGSRSIREIYFRVVVPCYDICLEYFVQDIRLRCQSVKFKCKYYSR